MRQYKKYLYICIVIIAVITNKEIRGNTINRLDLAATKSGLFSFMEIEIWKDIIGYEGLYKISNLGRVKSLKMGREIILKLSDDGKGYLRVSLIKNGCSKSKKVHKIVAESFLNHKPDGTHKLVVDHKDNDKKNNRLDNLQITTQRCNASKDRKGGTSKYIGVSWCKRYLKWKSCIYVNGKLKRLGLFNSETDAANSYLIALEQINKGIDIEILFPTRVPSSSYKGVSWHKRQSKWSASIIIDKKNKHLGYFNCELKAAEAYQSILNKL
jgi:hypothetical protein